MENVEEVKKKCKGEESRFGKRYGFELKLRCVKLRLEEEFPASLLSKEMGVSKDAVYRWVKAYQERGEAGLRSQVRSSGSRRKLPGAVREKISVQCAMLDKLCLLAEVHGPFEFRHQLAKHGLLFDGNIDLLGEYGQLKIELRVQYQ